MERNPLRWAKIFRNKDWDLVHQTPIGQPLRLDVRSVGTACSSSVPLLFALCRIAFHTGAKSYPKIGKRIARGGEVLVSSF